MTQVVCYTQFYAAHSKTAEILFFVCFFYRRKEKKVCLVWKFVWIDNLTWNRFVLFLFRKRNVCRHQMSEIRFFTGVRVRPPFKNDEWTK